MRRWNQNGTSRSRFLEGRYGSDPLGRFLSVAGCVALLAALLVRSAARGAVSGLLGALALAAVGWCYFRLLSRNYGRRAAENRKYLDLRDRALCWLHLQRDCFSQRKDYAFFRCPSCHQMVRVPKGKGRIRITCRRCGFAFEKKT